ncbi:electron transport complex subunit RsxG [Candidatus Competibacter phosphatis]|uniref:Ion-translocating oxidoreductase complex subunit G n=1 Tax=Candidatus Competibacter phosphatis TaxID=221280 RepID=A0ABX1TET8_9GAMM|nr:electron transport complex subunit RsxG [Candidatus Competibacter phosphatis]
MLNNRLWRGNLEWIRVISHWLKPEIRQSSGYPILLLGGVALLVSTAIGIANLGTNADIARRQLEDLQVTLQQVVPAEYYDNEPVRDTVTIQEGDRSVQVYRARRKGQVQAVSFRTTAPGYGSSEMVLIVGVDRDGKLLGVRVISHAETPGLGDKIETSKSNWILGFTGRSLSDPPPAGWGVKKDGGVFDQFTGATITPRAVVKSIKGGLEFFAAHRAVLLDEASGGHDQ